MLSRARVVILSVFGLLVLASIANVACSNVADVDSGLTESELSYGVYGGSGGYGSYGHGHGHYGGGWHGYGGYYYGGGHVYYPASTNIAVDVASH